MAIGSNVGYRKEYIEKPKILLNKNNIRILNSSSFYESLSWPNSKNPKFLNIVVRIKSNLTPLKLILKCKEIEILLGRRKSLKNSPRTCDIDILDYKKWTLNRDIILPHPRMHLRSFVLLPLFEINKAWVHPILKKHTKKLILSLSNRDIRSIKQI